MIAAPVIGHRGAASLAPENTLAGIRKAAETGARWVELDATLLGDGTPVLCHDDSLDRCSDRSGPLTALTAVDLDSIDVGGWFHLDWSREPMPKLADGLLLCQSLGLGLNLEIKPHGLPAQQIAQALFADISVYWAERDNLIISSFEAEVLAAYRALDASARLGLLFDALPQLWQLQAKALDVVSIHCDWQLLSAEDARQVKQAGYDLYCYTCNDPLEAQRLYQLGVDGIFTDYPQYFISGGITAEQSSFAAQPLPDQTTIDGSIEHT